MLYYRSMQIKTYLRSFFLIFLLHNLISCSSIDLIPSIPTSLPDVYKIDIQQGNEITSEMLMLLKPEMSKAQVRFVLGTPLIQDTFHEERWDYIYEPDAKELLDGLMQRYIESLVYQAVIENIACEQAAKMVAMKNATENAGTIIDELQLIYNNARQAAITQELSEIVAGAEAI